MTHGSSRTIICACRRQTRCCSTYFSDSEWHFGLDGAVAMANAYPETPLLLHHWGVDAPDFPPFNADPASLPGRVDNPDRIIQLAPGKPFTLHPLAG